MTFCFSKICRIMSVLIVYFSEGNRVLFPLLKSFLCSTPLFFFHRCMTNDNWNKLDPFVYVQYLENEAARVTRGVS